MSAHDVSKSWRVKGNYSYRNYQQSNDNGRRKSFLENALKSYYQAFETAENSDDRSSAAKNFAMASWRLATVLHSLNEKLVQVEFQFCEAIKYFSKGMVIGRPCKSSKWISDMDESYKLCIVSGTQFLQNYPYSARAISLEKFLRAMCEESRMADCFLEMATVMSHAGFTAVGNKDHMTALQALHDCYRPVQECFRLSKKDSEIFKEASIIEQDVYFHLATAEALQAIKMGDDTLKAALENEESMNMSMVYDAMDLYKRAVVATRELEVEMEAIALSRLGSLFDKVLKIKSKAREYFKMCMLLANSLHPRTFNKEAWFNTCTETLQRYETEDTHNNEVVRLSERMKCYKELEQERKDINGADIGPVTGFLRHVYKTYPPKNEEHKLDANLGDLDTKSTKKLILSAIAHYHPDKQDQEKYGLKWVVLCEEITKVLNNRYGSYKCPD